MKEIHIARVYDDLDDAAGKRVLVDRLWPRGKSKEALKLDLWAKDISPTTELRKKFNHTEEEFPEFRTAYRKELSENPAAGPFIATVGGYLKESDVFLLYAAKARELNQAVVLKEWLEEALQR